MRLHQRTHSFTFLLKGVPVLQGGTWMMLRPLYFYNTEMKEVLLVKRDISKIKSILHN